MKRRQFIYTTAWGSAITMTAPGLHANPATEADPVLVIIQLAGGNDGLNTVIPIGNDHYYKARPRLGIKAADTLKINDETGLHGNLSGLMSLYDSGQLAIIEGVGYPNPNRSHFRSTEIWHTGSDANKVEDYGWVGRYFDTYCTRLPASVGLTIGKQNPQAFTASMPKGVTFENNSRNRSRSSGMTMVGGDDDESDSGSSIGSLAGGGPSTADMQDPLAFLESTATAAETSSKQINDILGRIKAEGTFPDSGFARDLQVVSRLIRGGMPSKVYYLSLGGFDTHANQAGAHANLMTQAGDALHAFQLELKKTGQGHRTAVMVYSEFGRRVKENGSAGTDHGVAGPVFVVGDTVKGGFYGARPSLAPEKLIKGDIAHTTDYRSVYATLLEHHLNVDSTPVLLKKFDPLGFI